MNYHYEFGTCLSNIFHALVIELHREIQEKYNTFTKLIFIFYLGKHIQGKNIIDYYKCYGKCSQYI